MSSGLGVLNSSGSASLGSTTNSYVTVTGTTGTNSTATTNNDTLNLKSTDSSINIIGTGTSHLFDFQVRTGGFGVAIGTTGTNSTATTPTANFTFLSSDSSLDIIGSGTSLAMDFSFKAHIHGWTTNLTFGTTNFGTITGLNAKYQRTVNNMKGNIQWYNGTVVAAAGGIVLPAGLNVSSPTFCIVGTWIRASIGANGTMFGSDAAGPLFCNGGTNTLFFANSGQSGLILPRNISQMMNTGDLVSAYFDIQIASWS